MKRLTRFVGLSLALIMVMGLGFGAVSAQDETTIVIGWEQEPNQLSPIVAMTFASVMQQFYQRDVWDWDTNNQIYPVMVEEIPSFDNGMVETLESGNTQVTYNLREGMMWSDGEAITSADCEFWHSEIMMKPESGTIQRGTYPEVVESFEVVDDYTFVMTYSVPFPDFLSQNTATCGYPEHILRPQLEEFGTLDDAPFFTVNAVSDMVGYGPYVFGNWTIGSEATWVKNDMWDGQEPAIDRIIARFIPEAAQMRNALEAGEIDMAFNFADDQVDAYLEIPGVEVWSTPGVYGDAIWINYGNNVEGSPLEDVNVRKAIIHAIDRVSLAEELVGPGTDVPRSWYAQQFWPSEEDLPLIEYDPEMAAQLLDEAGWTLDENATIRTNADGDQLILRFFTTSGRQIRENYQVFIADYLGEVGISVQLLPIPSGILFDTFVNRGVLSTGDFDLALFALSTDPLSPFADAPTWLGCSGLPTAENPSGRNGWGACSPEFDELDLQVGTTVDPEERMQLAHQAQVELFGDEQFWHGLYLRPTWYAVQSEVFDPNTMQDLGTLSSNWFNKVEFWQPAS
jgi:peptide/nickel transport system substrate-binding protein